MKRNTKTLLLSALVCAGLALSACGDNNAGKGNSAPAAQADTTSAQQANQDDATKTYATIGVLNDIQPISFLDIESHDYIGHDIDLAKEACKRAELNCRIRPILLGDLERELVKDKSIDAAWSNIVITEDRKKLFAFSEPYMKNKQVAMVRADSPIRSKADLGGKKVVVEQGSVAEQIVRGLSGAEAPAEIITVTQTVDGSQQVSSGKADAVIYDHLTLEYFANNTPGQLRIVDDALREDGIGVAVRPDDTELLGKINQALAAMEADGTSRQIYEKWFSKK